MLRAIECGIGNTYFNSAYTDELKEDLDGVIYKVFNHLRRLPLSCKTEDLLIKDEGFINLRRKYESYFFYSNNWKKGLVKYQKTDNKVLSNHVKNVLNLIGCIKEAQSPSLMEKTLGGLSGAFLCSMASNEAHSLAVTTTFFIAILSGILVICQLATFKNREKVIQLTDELYKTTHSLYRELHSFRDVELIID